MKTLGCLLFLLATGTVSAQLKVNFDFSNLDQTIAFMRKGENATRQDIDDMLASPGVKTIIRKIRANDSLALVALQNVARGVKSTGKAANFQYDFIKLNLSGLDSFATRLKAGRSIILDSIRSLAEFLPAGKQAEVTVTFLAGGFSAGFTMGDGNIFYVGTHQYKNDFNGIVNTCQHELFHNIQSLLYSRKTAMDKLEKDKADSILYAYYLAQNLFVEGSAEFVADSDKFPPTAYIKNERDHASVNAYRMADNFYLIDRLITDAFHYTDKSNVDAAYSIMFDWNWNNPGYAAGKLMTAALVKAYGRGCLQKYLSSDPMIFVRDYIKLTRSAPGEHPYTFSAEFEKIIDMACDKVSGLAALP